jgi:type IV secretory pathway VirB2 component (pilin)
MIDDSGLAQTGAIDAAVGWLQGTLLGTVATTIAVIAIATVGLLMLSGRVNVRRAVQVVVGCFIVFGASTIAAGMQTMLFGGAGAVDRRFAEEAPPPVPVTPPPTTAVPDNYDPYAGAALPPAR